MPDETDMVRIPQLRGLENNPVFRLYLLRWRFSLRAHIATGLAICFLMTLWLYSHTINPFPFALNISPFILMIILMIILSILRGSLRGDCTEFLAPGLSIGQFEELALASVSPEDFVNGMWGAAIAPGERWRARHGSRFFLVIAIPLYYAIPMPYKCVPCIMSAYSVFIIASEPQFLFTRFKGAYARAHQFLKMVEKRSFRVPLLFRANAGSYWQCIMFLMITFQPLYYSKANRPAMPPLPPGYTSVDVLGIARAVAEIAAPFAAMGIGYAIGKTTSRHYKTQFAQEYKEAVWAMRTAMKLWRDGQARS